jgi:glycosyltransferase involved in cell wall biosynthesis
MATVSVIVTNYNQIKWIGKTLESVLRQSRLPNTIIISDDSSTDGSRDILNDYGQKYPDLFKLDFALYN